MSTKETRKKLADMSDAQRALHAAEAERWQVALPPAEVKALLAEHCPESMQDLKKGLAERTPSHVVLTLTQIDELLAGASKKDDGK